MEASTIYEEYFKKKIDVLSELITYYKKEGKRIACWGAGKKGVALLNVIDSKKKSIDFVYDKDIKKVGTKLPSGHEIVDYHKENADIVFVANSVFELEVIHMLEDVNPKACVINVDNIVLGDLPLEAVLTDKELDLKPVRKQKICAIVVLYNPDDAIYNNISSYASDLDKLYLYDNSKDMHKEIEEKYRDDKQIEYIYKGKNEGLPIAFNEIGEIARKDKYDWMITFDQDSHAEEGMISSMREYVESIECDDKVAIVAPVVNEIDTKKEVQSKYSTYFDKVIQSGAMHNLNIMKQIGDYDENMFIDEVDNEYCARCIVNGYKIIKINNALLMHNQQDDGVQKKFVEGTTVFINKFSADRYYYRYRNALYCYDKYKVSYPLYALDCLNTIRKLKLNLPYEKDIPKYSRAIQQAIDDYNEHHMGGREDGK